MLEGLDAETIKCHWPYIILSIIALASIIWFLVHLFRSILRVQGKDEWQDMKRSFQDMMYINEDVNQQQNPQYKNGKSEYSYELATICQQIDIALSEYFWTQLIYLAVLFIVFFLTVQLWFIPFLGGYFMCMVFGALTIPVLAFFAVKYTTKSLSQTLISANIGKEEALSYTLNNGFALTFLFVGGTFLIFFITFLFATLIVKEMNQEGLKEISIMLFGYLMGLTLGCFVYREGASLMARGMKTATFGLIKSENSLHLDNTFVSHMTKLAHMVQSQVGQILVNFLDTVLVLGLLCVSSVAILANSAEISATPCEQRLAIYSPIMIIMTTFVGAIVAYLVKITFDVKQLLYVEDNEAAWFTAINIRWVMIVQSVVSLILVIAIPFASFKEEPFALAGADTTNIDKAGITVPRIMSCGILGLLTNIFLVSLYEYYTSHGCSPVRNLALSSVPRLLSMNLIFANYLGGLAGFLPVMVIAFMIYTCMAIASYVGLLFFGTGYLASIYVIMPIYFVGSATTDSYRLSCFANFYDDIQDTIHKMCWASRNYMVYLKVTNTDKKSLIRQRGAIILSLVVVGAILFQNGSQGDVFYGPGLSALILGLASANLIKGLNARAVVKISKDYAKHFGDREYQQIQQDDRIYTLTENQYMSSILSILINFFIITLLVVFVGLFMGLQSLVGFMLGFLIATAQIMFSGIIIGQVLENARIYNEAGNNVNKTENVYSAHVQGEIFGYATEETNGSPLLVYLIYVVALSYSGSMKVQEWGGLITKGLNE